MTKDQLGSTAHNTLLPEYVLYGSNIPAALPACEHFAPEEKFIGKALALQNQIGPLFDITCDCEDGAAVGEEPSRLAMFIECINSRENQHRRMGVRIHDNTHPLWREEVNLLIRDCGDKLAYITLPKTQGPREVLELVHHIKEAATHFNLTRTVPIHVLIESPSAFRKLDAIAAIPTVESLDFGIMDFVSSLNGAVPMDAIISPLQFQHPLLALAKSQLVSAALSHGLIPTHNICSVLEPAEAAELDAYRARSEFGFERMWSVHIKQIAPILKGMRIDDLELHKAAEILHLAQKARWGPIRHQGRLHDRASYRYYWSLLRQAHTLRQNLPKYAASFFH